MFENPRRGRQTRNFATNVPKILVLKSSSEQIFSRKLSLGAPDQLAKVSVNSITVGSVDVSSAGEARDLGMWLDSKLTMSTHINKTCRAAFF